MEQPSRAEADEPQAGEQHVRLATEPNMHPVHEIENSPSEPDADEHSSDSSNTQPEAPGFQNEERKDVSQTALEDEQHREEEEEAEDEVSISASSSYEEFCGQQASEMNLRRIKMDALEDLVVCGQSREATESARRLFSCLGEKPSKEAQSKGSGSLSSRSSGRGEEFEDDEDDELMAALARHKQHGEQPNNNNNNDISEHIIEEIYSSAGHQDDYGTIKISPRKFCPSACSDCSAGSSSGRPHSSYGSTLVCALSPSRASQAGSENAREQATSPSSELYCYPIDGDEIRQCRLAFRENRRLIEQAQARALKRMHEEAAEASLLSGRLSRCSSQATLMTDRSHWTDSLRKRAQLPECSHCRQKVYPLDRLELDFTRAKLNMHRNCFKCQVCHTLLRLETYASIDTKLFCPAHTKLAAPVAIR